MLHALCRCFNTGFAACDGRVCVLTCLLSLCVSLRCGLCACAGRAGVPMEVMGLMLGEFVDDYTVHCVDVFAMPQSGTGVSVEAVDPVFQQQMLEMLKQTGRYVVVVLRCVLFLFFVAGLALLSLWVAETLTPPPMPWRQTPP